LSVPGIGQFRQRVTLTPFAREDGLFSQPSFNESGKMVLRARVKKISQRMRRPGGEEVLLSSEALIHSPAYTITERDKIALPDGSTPAIVDVKSEPDQRGRTRVYLVKFGNSRRTG